MRWAQTSLLVVLLAPWADAQDLLLARIKSRAAENLKRVPNYTCALAVERMSRTPDSERFKLIDRLRLEVALIGEKELYAWPGSDKFGETSIDQLIPGGSIVSGDFALFASSIFLSPLTTFTPAGETTLDGTRAIRYVYVVPRTKTGYFLRTEYGSATVGYHGFVCVDAQTLDLLRLEVTADDLPPGLGLKNVFDSIDYRRLRVGDSDFLLPVSSGVQTVYYTGGVTRNRTQFSGCRQFVGESAISFGEAQPLTALAAPRKAAEVALAPGLSLDLRLEAEIDSLAAAIGDPVTARVASDVKKDGEVVVPKGALVFGRITVFESGSPRSSFFPGAPSSGGVPFHTIGLRFFTLEFADSRAKFTARLADLGPAIGFVSPQAASQLSGAPGRQMMILIQLSKPLTGLGVFNVAGERVRLPRGFRMLWQTDVP